MKINKVLLGDVASVEVSGVDKKTHPQELPVKLCNFVDVYYNWAITKAMSDSFMDATVKQKELDSFAIHKGQVAITKDSETREDIGIATYIADNFDNVVLGYHCALITPQEDKLDGGYLNAVLHTSYARVFFSNYASGSGQRYALSADCIKQLPLYLPPIAYQQQVSSLFEQLDRKIKANKAINDNLMQIASTTFMHYFFKRTPNGKLGSIIIEHPKSDIQVGEAQNSSGNVPFFTSGDSILKWDTVLVDDRCCYLNTGGNADVKFYVGKAAYSTDTWCISGNDQLSDYLYLLLYAIKPELDKKFFQGTGLKHLQKPLLKDRPIYIPTTQELNVFNAQIMPMMTKISENARENQRLMSIRDWLLPLLMNGQATVEA